MARPKKDLTGNANIFFRRPANEVAERMKYLGFGQKLSGFEKEMADIGFAYKIKNQETAKSLEKKIIENQTKHQAELVEQITGYSKEVLDLKEMLGNVINNQNNMTKVFVRETVREISSGLSGVIDSPSAGNAPSPEVINRLGAQNNELISDMKKVMEYMAQGATGDSKESIIPDDRMNQFITTFKRVALGIILANETIKNSLDKETIEALRKL